MVGEGSVCVKGLWMLVSNLLLTSYFSCKQIRVTVVDACKSLIFNLTFFFVLTDKAVVSENSEAFVCLVEDASGKVTLYNNARTFNGKLLFLIAIKKVVFTVCYFG